MLFKNELSDLIMDLEMIKKASIEELEKRIRYIIEEAVEEVVEEAEEVAEEVAEVVEAAK